MPVMPFLNLGRVLAATLSTVLLVGVNGSAFAADQSTEVVVPPPSLEVALAVLAADPMVAGAAARNVVPSKVRLPRCQIKDEPTRFDNVKYWKKTLLDTNLKVGPGYKPWDLVSVSRAGIAGSGRVRKVMIEDLTALAQAARRAGKPLAVRSSYRSYDYQRALFDSYARTYGRTNAIKFSARPGHSEHQMGTTIDFTTAPGVPLSTRFGDSPAGKWLSRNGWRYGFIMSYPAGKKSASCYTYEPWHWRYFGRSLARKIHQSGQVPRRYLYTNFESAR
jgi:D-alanyl-D-alanine carboxypeptidase